MILNIISLLAGVVMEYENKLELISLATGIKHLFLKSWNSDKNISSQKISTLLCIISC